MISRILKKVQSLYTGKQATLYSSTLVVALTLLLARILGVVKLRVFTSYYSKEQLDLFFAAFRIPDFIFEALIVGSISSCFIPVVSHILKGDKSRKEASSFAQSVSLLFLGIWFLVLLLSIPFYESLNQLMLPGYSASQAKAVSDMSLIILYTQVPFLLIGNIAAALLQNEKQFFIPGLAPVFYNIGIILGVVLWAPSMGLNAALYGVIIGAIMYFLIVVPGVWALGYSFQKRIDFAGREIRKFFTMFVPRLFTSLVAQIDASVDLALATIRGLGNYSPFYLAKNVQILPVSFLGIAIAQTALPFFSDLYNEGKKKELVDMFVKLISHIFFIMMPIVMLLTVLRLPIVRLLVGGDKFDWDGTVLTAQVLSIFALSLPFHTMYYVITRVFYALHDTKTTFITGLVFTVLNTILSILFVVVWALPVTYLAVSFSISITLNVFVLFYLLFKRLDHIRLLPLLTRFFMIGLIGLASSMVTYVAKQFLDGLVFDTTRTINLLTFTLTCSAIGISTYTYLAWILVPGELAALWSLVTRLDIFKRLLYQKKKTVYTGEVQTSSHEEKIPHE